MLRCSKKAFAKCPSSYLCGTREDATFTEDSECAAFNREVECKTVFLTREEAEATLEAQKGGDAK